jgi:hypothetical protein
MPLVLMANACTTHIRSQFKLLLHRDFTEKFPCSTTRSPKKIIYYRVENLKINEKIYIMLVNT